MTECKNPLISAPTGSVYADDAVVVVAVFEAVAIIVGGGAT
jgi:hypothetical protein